MHAHWLGCACTRTTDPPIVPGEPGCAKMGMVKVQKKAAGLKLALAALSPPLLPSGPPSNPALTPPPLQPLVAATTKTARILEGLPLLLPQTKHAGKRSQVASSLFCPAKLSPQLLRKALVPCSFQPPPVTSVFLSCLELFSLRRFCF